MTAGARSKRDRSTSERDLDIPGLRVVEPVINLSAAHMDYRNFRLHKKSSHYDGDVINKLHRMIMKRAVQIKDGISSRKEPMSVIAFLQ